MAGGQSRKKTGSRTVLFTALPFLMDVVLEVFDTFLLDRLYAILLPATSPSVASTAVKDAVKDAATATFTSMREAPTSYHAASQFLQLEPSDFAYMSAWPRDNACRQTLSLYLITWYRRLQLPPGFLSGH
ncbi:MAG: hypothetical protein Q9187_006313 [Circinaria calcarea]